MTRTPRKIRRSTAIPPRDIRWTTYRRELADTGIEGFARYIPAISVVMIGIMSSTVHLLRLLIFQLLGTAIVNAPISTRIVAVGSILMVVVVAATAHQRVRPEYRTPARQKGDDEARQKQGIFDLHRLSPIQCSGSGTIPGHLVILYHLFIQKSIPSRGSVRGLYAL